MARSVREQMVDSAVILLATRGLDGTSFTEVLSASGAPRGSIYHHFPGGKDELIAAAIEVAGGRAVALLRSFEGRSPVEIVDGFFAMWRAVLERSQFTAGCSVLAVTVAGSHGVRVIRTGCCGRRGRSSGAGSLRSRRCWRRAACLPRPLSRSRR